MNFLIGHLFTLLCWSSNRVSSANISMRPQTNDQILGISTKHSPPFMHQALNGSFHSGMEFQLVQMMARMLNMSVDLQTTSNRSDICHDVVTNVSDICIGGIFPREDALQYTSMSVTYASDDLTWCVRKAGIMPMYLAFMLFMHPTTWFSIIFGIAYPISLLLYVYLPFDREYEQRNQRDWHYALWLVTLPTSLGMSSNFRPVGWILRTYYTLFAVMGFFFFQIVFTELYDYLHQQVPWYQVSSFAEIIENDFDLVGSPEAFNLLNRSRKISSEKIESFFICVNISECFSQLLHHKNIVIGGSRQKMLNSPLNSPSKVFCFEDLDNVATYPIALYMRRDFHLNEKVNEILLRLLEAGFFVKWKIESQFKGKYEEPYKIPLRLPITHIGAALLFGYGVGTLLSVSTFVLEELVGWKMKQKRVRRFWIYVEQFVDGHRHYLKNLPERLELHNKHLEIPFPYLD